MQNNKSSDSLNEDFWNEETNSCEETDPFSIKREEMATPVTIHKNDISNVFNDDECLETITGNFTDLKVAMGMEKLNSGIENTYLKNVVAVALENKKIGDEQKEKDDEIGKNGGLNIEEDGLVGADKNEEIAEKKSKNEIANNDEIEIKNSVEAANDYMKNNGNIFDLEKKSVFGSQATDNMNNFKKANFNFEEKLESFVITKEDSKNNQKVELFMDEKLKNKEQKLFIDGNSRFNEKVDKLENAADSLKKVIEPSNDFWDESEGEGGLPFNLNDLNIERDKVNIENNIFQGGLAIDPSKFIMDAKRDEIYNESDIIEDEYNLNNKKAKQLDSVQKNNDVFIEQEKDINIKGNTISYIDDSLIGEQKHNEKTEIISLGSKEEIVSSGLGSILNNLTIKDNINVKNKVYGTIDSKYIISGLIPKANIKTDTDTRGFYFNPTPRIKYLKNRIIIGLPEKQKRIDLNKKEQTYIKTRFEIITIDYKLVDILDVQKESKIDIVNNMLNVEKGIDNYINLISKDKIRLYLGEETPKSNEITESLIQAYFLNKGIAIEQAIHRKNYALALLMGMGTEFENKTKEAYLENFNPIIKPFFGLPRTNKDWRSNFSLLLRNPNDSIFIEMIKETDLKDRISIFLAFALIWDAKIEFKKLPNCFEFLRVCLNLKLNLKDEINIVKRYVSVMEESNLDTKKIREKYKLVGDKKKNGWFSGLRSVVDKGISKIVGVDVEEESVAKKNESVVKKNENVEMDSKMVYTKIKKNADKNNKIICNTDEMNTEKSNFNVCAFDKNNVIIGNTDEVKIENNNANVDAFDKNNIIINNTDEINTEKNNIIVENKNVNINYNGAKKVYGSIRHGKIENSTINKNIAKESDENNHLKKEPLEAKEEKVDNLVAKDESMFLKYNPFKKNDTKYEIKEDPKKEKIYILEEDNKVYKKAEYSQSVDSFCDSIIPDAFKEELPVESAKKPGFFSRLNIFSKSKRYKVELEENDFKYDPVTKKWISAKAKASKSAMTGSVEQTVEPKPIPILPRSVSVNDLTIGNKNRYVNKVKTEENGNEVKSFIPKIHK